MISISPLLNHWLFKSKEVDLKIDLVFLSIIIKYAHPFWLHGASTEVEIFEGGFKTFLSIQNDADIFFWDVVGKRPLKTI